MSYASYSTLNKIGLKTVGPATLAGQIKYLGGLRGLGDVPPQPNAVTSTPNSPSNSGLSQLSMRLTGVDFTDPASWYQITGELQQIFHQLKTIEAILRANSSLGASYRSQAVSAMEQYQPLVSQWSEVYGIAFGAPPTGLWTMRVVPMQIKRQQINSLGLGGTGIALIVLTPGMISAAAKVVSGIAKLSSAIATLNAALATQKTLGRLGQGIVQSYNEGVTEQEQNTAAAAEAPDNSPEMQMAIQNAINAGNDLTTVMNLWESGADLIQMELLSTGVPASSITAPGSQPLTSAQLQAAYAGASSGSTPSTGNFWYWVAAIAVVAIVAPPLIKKL